MAKIGTAHVEVKVVLNEDTLEETARKIEDRIAQAVAEGLRRGHSADA